MKKILSDQLLTPTAIIAGGKNLKDHGFVSWLDLEL
jgi:hypothetical protein